ncbi:methyl-accepting chemotaxis protein [Pseudomonas sp. CDFA 610]|nr:methyl-accepting chemotaxis protein [Pseudomonas sp. CDFA 610]MCD5981933.1 methyl-accepting chemotaxis protein [Pseudomonas sp. CDFA 610]
MKIRNLNLAPRSAVFFSLIISIVIALGIVAINQMEKLHEVEQDVELNWMASIRQTGLMNSGVLRLRLESLRAVTTPDEKIRQDTIVQFDGFRRKLDDAVAQYEPLIASEEERRLYLAVNTEAGNYSKQLDAFERLVRAEDNASAVLLINNVIRPLTNALGEKINALTLFNDEGARQAGLKASALYTQGFWTVVGLIGIVVVLTLILATLLIRSVISPTREALAIAERIAAGDLSEDIHPSGRDEAGRLLVALETMQVNLRNTISRISDSSTQLASASEEMTAVTENASKGLVRQNDEVGQAATAVTEMTAAVDEVARNAEAASITSRQTMTYTLSGIENVAQTLKAIEGLAGNVVETGTQVKALSTRAQDISKVVEVIRAIAEQTNLLALNAAIEAARAGEQGRGFAVVADEVRALAHRTQQSTLEIEQMISAIQGDSTQAVTAMNVSSDMATRAIGVAQSADASLKQIVEAITLINESNSQIATASEEQAQVAREADRNLTAIRELSTQSAAASSQTASACGEMANLAVELNRLVGNFKF